MKNWIDITKSQPSFDVKVLILRSFKTGPIKNQVTNKVVEIGYLHTITTRQNYTLYEFSIKGYDGNEDVNDVIGWQPLPDVSLPIV